MHTQSITAEAHLQAVTTAPRRVAARLALNALLLAKADAKDQVRGQRRQARNLRTMATSRAAPRGYKLAPGEAMGEYAAAALIVSAADPEPLQAAFDAGPSPQPIFEAWGLFWRPHPRVAEVPLDYVIRNVARALAMQRNTGRGRNETAILALAIGATLPQRPPSRDLVRAATWIWRRQQQDANAASARLERQRQHSEASAVVRTAKSAERQRVAVRLRGNGWRVARIAASLSLSERQVKRLLAKERRT